MKKRNQGRIDGMTTAELKQPNQDITKSANMDKQASLMKKFNENLRAQTKRIMETSSKFEEKVHT